MTRSRRFRAVLGRRPPHGGYSPFEASLGAVSIISANPGLTRRTLGQASGNRSAPDQGHGKEAAAVRQAFFVVVMVAAAFLGGAMVNGPAVHWTQARLLDYLGLKEGEIASVDLPAAARPKQRMARETQLLTHRDGSTVHGPSTTIESPTSKAPPSPPSSSCYQSPSRTLRIGVLQEAIPRTTPRPSKTEKRLCGGTRARKARRPPCRL